MKYFTWLKGRQASGYDKMLILQGKFPLPFDCYLLLFKSGSTVPIHKDQVEPSKRHFRMNIILKKAKSGGHFWSERSILNWSRIKIFRPDINFHSVSKVEEGTRYVLSIGWLLESERLK